MARKKRHIQAIAFLAIGANLLYILYYLGFVHMPGRDRFELAESASLTVRGSTISELYPLRPELDVALAEVDGELHLLRGAIFGDAVEIGSLSRGSIEAPREILDVVWVWTGPHSDSVALLVSVDEDRRELWRWSPGTAPDRRPAPDALWLGPDGAPRSATDLDFREEGGDDTQEGTAPSADEAIEFEGRLGAHFVVVKRGESTLAPFYVADGSSGLVLEQVDGRAIVERVLPGAWRRHLSYQTSLRTPRALHCVPESGECEDINPHIWVSGRLEAIGPIDGAFVVYCDSPRKRRARISLVYHPGDDRPPRKLGEERSEKCEQIWSRERVVWIDRGEKIERSEIRVLSAGALGD